ncbi:MAG: DUF6364 family protein [Dehalococcoidia bacterium]|nr:DUF6364 family protein [Dehalococcoidia bacterium]
MKNITVSVDEGTYRRAEEWAERRGISVSALVKEYLDNLPQRSPSPPSKTLSEVIADIRASGGGIDPSENLTRDELYDRNAIR